jgi:hypothetical protein
VWVDLLSASRLLATIFLAPDGLPSAFNRPFGQWLVTNSTENEAQLIGIKGHVEFLVDI